MENKAPYLFTSLFFGVLRVFLNEDGLWFSATDVSKALALSMSDVKDWLWENDKAMRFVDYSLSSTPEPNPPLVPIAVLSEAAVFTLVLRSDSPTAESFQHWVAHEILPFFYKKESYSVVLPSSIDDQVACAMAWKEQAGEIALAQKSLASIIDMIDNELITELRKAINRVRSVAPTKVKAKATPVQKEEVPGDWKAVRDIDWVNTKFALARVKKVNVFYSSLEKVLTAISKQCKKDVKIKSGIQRFHPEVIAYAKNNIFSYCKTHKNVFTARLITWRKG